MSSYIIGIDLGTTNTAVAFLDTSVEDGRPQMFALTQVSEAGENDEQALLPSFLYLPDDKEISAGSLDLPWAKKRDFCVGAFARKNAALLPGKTVSSAKSWLCAPHVDRLEPILPWERQNREKMISPVEASRHCLEHIKDAWNHRMAGADPAKLFENQKIILTVPASFDAVARELTVQAAREAGLTVTLIEEPQAAFYCWLHEHDAWRETVQVGDRILVCDLGGGTSDFSLIEVTGQDGALGLERIAVGEHILLGGDNMDLTLAYAVAQKLKKDKGLALDAYQLAGLTHACREAKEVLCADPAAPPRTLTVLGRGSSLIGGTITAQLSFEDCEQVLLDGFFPSCAFDDQPRERKQSGLRTFGLNYTADPAITRHLASFLNRNATGSKSPLPTALLFNGGVTKSGVFQDRLVAALRGWGDAGGKAINVLSGAKPDLAVSLGACWYGLVSTGKGIRIKAGTAHSYYVGIESSQPAVPGFAAPLQGLCVVPFGMEEGSTVEIPYDGLGLVVGETTEFAFFASNGRQDDPPGHILPGTDTSDLFELPRLSARLDVNEKTTPSGTLVPVTLKAVLTEIGTLQLWCVEENGSRQWKLEYELRTAGDEPAPDNLK